MYHQVLKWTKKEQRKERGKGLLDWVDRESPAIRLHLGKRLQISKDVSQLMEESPGRGNSKCKSSGKHYVTGENRRSCAWSMVNQGQLDRRPSQKASTGQDDAGPSRPKGWDWTLGEQWEVRGWRTWSDMDCSINFVEKRPHGGKGGSTYKQKTKWQVMGGGRRVTSDQILRISCRGRADRISWTLYYGIWKQG